jgi:hypothetical protein
MAGLREDRGAVYRALGRVSLVRQICRRGVRWTSSAAAEGAQVLRMRAACQESATVGTVFHRTRNDLTKWLSPPI